MPFAGSAGGGRAEPYAEVVARGLQIARTPVRIRPVLPFPISKIRPQPGRSPAVRPRSVRIASWASQRHRRAEGPQRRSNLSQLTPAVRIDARRASPCECAHRRGGGSHSPAPATSRAQCASASFMAWTFPGMGQHSEARKTGPCLEATYSSDVCTRQTDISRCSLPWGRGVRRCRWRGHRCRRRWRFGRGGRGRRGRRGPGRPCRPG